MNNNARRLNSYWILLDNQRMVHMFSNRSLLANIKEVDKTINVYPSGGATHCSTAVTLKNIGEVYLRKNGLANILSYAKVTYKHNITYKTGGTFSPPIHPTNISISEKEKGGYTIITVNPTTRSVTSRSCKMLNKIKKSSQIEISGTQNRRDPHTTWWDTHQRQILGAWYVSTC